MAKQISVELTKAKECKGSIRYETTDEDAPVTNIYLSRTFDKPMPETVYVTVESKDE